jgi:hypothetical protein
MSERGTQLLETAVGQITELIGLLSRRGQAGLSLLCPGREKLGDGTVAALALHTADNYLRIAGFLEATSQLPPAQPDHQLSSRIPLAHGRTPRRGARGLHADCTHDGNYAAERADLPDLLERLSAGRDALSLLADLNDDQFDAAPPIGSFRFCDGQRTLEEVVASLLRHQAHQIEAITAAASGDVGTFLA